MTSNKRNNDTILHVTNDSTSSSGTSGTYVVTKKQRTQINGGKKWPDDDTKALVAWCSNNKEKVTNTRTKKTDLWEECATSLMNRDNRWDKSYMITAVTVATKWKALVAETRVS
jgi:hypothetical protein